MSLHNYDIVLHHMTSYYIIWHHITSHYVIHLIYVIPKIYNNQPLLQYHMYLLSIPCNNMYPSFISRNIVYASWTLSTPEKNYSATKLECLAVVWAVGYLHAYIHGKCFTLITDHSALCHLFNTVTPTRRLAWWVMRLQAYDFKIVHRVKKKHINVDSSLWIH